MLGHPTRTTNNTPGFFGRLWNNVRGAYLSAWLIVLAIYLILPIPMWAALQTWDSGAWRFLNAIPTILGTVGILFCAYRPTNWAYAGPIGGFYDKLMDKDGSQGVAGGFAALYRLALWFAFGFFMLGVTLTTWDMSEAPGAFWLAYLSIFGIMLCAQLLRLKGLWAPWIAMVYLFGCLYYAISMTLGDVADQKAIDPSTGFGTKMGYINSTGVFVDDPLERAPEECVPTGQKFLLDDGTMFSFADNNQAWLDKEDGAVKPGCFSTTGIPLEPFSADVAPDTSKFSIKTLIDLFTVTPEERAAKKASAETAFAAKVKAAAEAEQLAKDVAAEERARKKAEAETAEAVRIAKAEEAKLAEEARLEQLRLALLEASKPYTETPCGNKFPPAINCLEIVFNKVEGVKYTPEAPDDNHCLGMVLGKSATISPTGVITPKHVGARVYVYHVPRGTAVKGFFCNEKVA